MNSINLHHIDLDDIEIEKHISESHETKWADINFKDKKGNIVFRAVAFE